MENYFTSNSSTVNANSKTLKAADFFSDNNPEGYSTKASFKALAEKMRPKERKDYAGLMEQFRTGTKIQGNFDLREDRAGNLYGFVNCYLPRAVKGFKIIMDPDIQRFINDYAEGKITVDFTADELAKIAFNS